MNAYTKVAQAVIRLIAFALVVISFLLYVDDLRLLLSQKPLSRPGLLILKAMPLLIGLVLIGKSRALAEHFTKDLE